MKEQSYRYTTHVKKIEDIGPQITGPETAASWIKTKTYHEKDSWREQATAIFTDKNNRIIGYEILSTGTQDKCLLDIKPLCRTALEIMADGIVVVHNHPHENPKPSMKDIELTNKIKKALSCLEIHFLDFIILGEKENFSFNKELIFT